MAQSDTVIIVVGAGLMLNLTNIESENLTGGYARSRVSGLPVVLNLSLSLFPLLNNGLGSFYGT